MGTAEGAAKARETRKRNKETKEQALRDTQSVDANEVQTDEVEPTGETERTVDPPKQKRGAPVWKPASLLTHPPMPGFRLRWVSKAQLSKRVAEGWEVVQKGGRPVTSAPDLERTGVDASKMDSTTQLRELILCRMPEEMARSREAYYKNMTDSLLDGVKALDTQSGLKERK